MTEIIDNLYLGDLASLRDKDYLTHQNFDLILDVNYYYGSFHNPVKFHKEQGLFPKLELKQYPLEDTHSEDPFKYFDSIYAHIETALNNNKKVYIHCQMGISRSPTIVIAYLMKKYQWNRDKAVAFVKDKRPWIAPNSSFMKYLAAFEEELLG